VVLHEILDIHVWVPCDATGDPVIINEAHPPQNPFAVGFATPEVAFAADLSQDTVAHTTLWSVLRATPEGFGFILEAGQESETIFFANEIDDVLGVARESASELSRAERIRRAYGRESEPRDLTSEQQAEIDGVRLPFPAGFDILLGELNQQRYGAYFEAAAVAQAGHSTQLRIVGQRIDSSLERVLLVTGDLPAAAGQQLLDSFTEALGARALAKVELATVALSDVPVVFREWVERVAPVEN
jgi:hypothetical protein